MFSNVLSILILGSYVTQLVGCWTHNPMVVGSTPLLPTVKCWITSLGKMLTWTVPLFTRGNMDTKL